AVLPARAADLTTAVAVGCHCDGCHLPTAERDKTHQNHDPGLPSIDRPSHAPLSLVVQKSCPKERQPLTNSRSAAPVPFTTFPPPSRSPRATQWPMVLTSPHPSVEEVTSRSVVCERVGRSRVVRPPRRSDSSSPPRRQREESTRWPRRRTPCRLASLSNEELRLDLRAPRRTRSRTTGFCGEASFVLLHESGRGFGLG